MHTGSDCVQSSEDGMHAGEDRQQDGHGECIQALIASRAARSARMLAVTASMSAMAVGDDLPSHVPQ
jgi:hypothetical protein